MTSPAPISPVVRWLAVALVACTLVLLALGGLTTSRRAGMDDPDWPTQPLHIFFLGAEFQEKSAGYFLEHSHRIAGWTVGGLAAALAFAAWLSGPDKRKRVLPLLAVVALLAAYGWFHGQMMAADRLRRETGTFTWPWPSILATGCGTAAVLLAAVRQVSLPDPARWVRFLATLVLLGVMAQGLLGGLRVFLNAQTGLKDTLGVELSQLHGLFAQVVFAGMVLLPPLAGPRPMAKELTPEDRQRVRGPAVAVPAAILVQLVWAVWVRHAQDDALLGVAQRLHLLTAFAVAGLIVWLVTRVALTPGARRPLGFASHLLAGLLLVQLLLGVEAWMGKFAATGPEGGTDPTARKRIYAEAGPVLLRTAHQLIGASLLASAVVVAFRVLRWPAVPGEPGLPGPWVPAAAAEESAPSPV